MFEIKMINQSINQCLQTTEKQNDKHLCTVTVILESKTTFFLCKNSNAVVLLCEILRPLALIEIRVRAVIY